MQDKRTRCEDCGGHGHDPFIECMHGDVQGVCIDDMCQPGETCSRCEGTGIEPEPDDEDWGPTDAR